jgi:riboflavin biosynthesis RibT protein
MEKIAMGLLSFMPMEKKDPKLLQQHIKKYETNPDWTLFLWKGEDEDILGLVGIRIDNEINVIIQDLSVNPSHRNLGIGKQMINEMNRLYSKKYTISPNEKISQFYNKCEENN